MFRIWSYKRPLFLLVFLFLAGALFVSWNPLAAQGGDPDRPEEPDRPLSESMEAFLEREAGGTPERMAATPCVGGMAGPYACDNVDLMAFMPVGDFDASSTNDIWGWTDPLDNKEYALLGLNNGTAFVDITDPENPVYLGKLPTHTSSSSWRDIKVYNDYAFVVSEAGGHGMQVFDLTELRGVVSPPVTFSNSAHYSQFGNSHNIAVNEDSGFAYAVGTNTCSGGLHMINIQNPLSPTNAGCYSGDGYTHDAECVNYAGPDPDYAGAEICINSNEDTVTIVDVTNKAAPSLVSRTGYPGASYTHQGWFLDGHRYYLQGDEADESSNGHNTRTYIWDLLDLDNPSLIGNHTGPNASIDHNMYVVGDNVFQSNYSSGLQILDLSDVNIADLEMVAYFDTYTPNNNASFNGSWSNYPYFESGNVVVTGIDEGLFIVAPLLAPDFQMSADTNSLDVCGSGSDMLALDLLARNGYTGTVTLSASGLPGGATPSFSPNPVMPPDTSDLTVTVAGTAAGDYPFTIMGSDLPLSHTLEATLHINDASPGLPVLSSPSDGAVDVEILPLLSWTAAAQGTSYYLEIAADAAFNTVVYSATTAMTSHQVTAPLEPETEYFWHVRGENICGLGSFSAAFSFTTMPIPPILLVDDDDNSPDVRGYYTDVLDNMGLAYDVWDTGNSDNEPTIGLLAPYTTIIWFTGDEFGGAAGPGSAGESALANWLDSGNCLFLNSQDYHYDRGQTPFMTNYLGFNSADDDEGDYGSVTGQGSLFGGMGPFSLSYPFTDYSDVVPPNGSAELAFDGNNGNDAAVNKDSGVYRTVFFGFPFEAISGAANRQSVLNRVLNWCGETAADGFIAGQVTDDTTGDPLPNTYVWAGSTVTGTVFTFTDNNGDYQFSLAPGLYEVGVIAGGYFTVTESGVLVTSGMTTTLDFDLVAMVGTLERDRDGIETTVVVGEMVTHTLVVSNSGTIPFDFTVSEGAPWAAVLPDGGTLAPGQSLALAVVFDGSAVGGIGTYMDTISFSGTFDNTPGDVELVLHVVEEADYSIYLPVMRGEGGAAAGGGNVGLLPWLGPLAGVVVVTFGRLKRRR